MNGEEKGYLERLFTEKFNHLDQRIDEVRGNTGKIFDKLDSLPCGVHEEKIKGLGTRLEDTKKSVNTRFALIFTVIGVIATIVGISIKVLAK